MQAVTRIMDCNVRGCQPVRQCIVPDIRKVICGRHTNEIRFSRRIEGSEGVKRVLSVWGRNVYVRTVYRKTDVNKWAEDVR